MKIYTTFFGYLTQCKCMTTGDLYPAMDWRSSYVSKCGLVSIWASEHKAPGKYFVYFLPYEPGQEQRYIRFSGDLCALENEYTITTDSSQYIFVKDDNCIATDDKIRLIFAKASIK